MEEIITISVSDSLLYEKAEIYIYEICKKNAKPLHLGEVVYPDFYKEIEKMLLSHDPYEENFILYMGSLPCGWLKVNGLDNPDDAWISMMAVEPKYHRLGIGTVAVGYAEEFLRSRHKRRALVRTTEDNIAAYNLYKSCGFAVKKMFEDIASDGVKRKWTVFEKELK